MQHQEFVRFKKITFGKYYASIKYRVIYIGI